MLNQRFSVRPILASTTLLCGVITFGGCASDGSADLGALFREESALDKVSPAVRDAGLGYVKTLSGLIASLKTMQGYQDALNLSNEIEPAVKSLRQNYDLLAATQGSERDNVNEAFGPKLKELKQKLTAERNRIASDSLLSRTLAVWLDQIKFLD